MKATEGTWDYEWSDENAAEVFICDQEDEAAFTVQFADRMAEDPLVSSKALEAPMYDMIHLIAAAPDLLAAAEDVLKDHPGWQDMDPSISTYKPIIALAKAISKAKGE